MGLLNFWKKKDLDDLPRIDAPSMPPSGSGDVNTLPDLPAVGGTNDVEGGAQQLPLLDEEPQASTAVNSKSLSVNMPTLDFSMPPLDDDVPQQPASVPVLEPETLEPPTPAVQQQESEPVPATPVDTSIDPEDLNKLFVNDNDWKEPDLEHYDPYGEEKIEEPNPEDFGAQELPAFEDTAQKQDFRPKPLVADVSISEPSEPFTERVSTQSPVELFIRGKAYARVFVELDQMNKLLSVIESKANSYEELLKKEEPLTLAAKEQAEYLYRRLNAIDKKVFVQ